MLSKNGKGNINPTKRICISLISSRGKATSIVACAQRSRRTVAVFISTRFLFLLGYVIFLPKSMFIIKTGEMYLVRNKSGNPCNCCFVWSVSVQLWFVLLQLPVVEPCFRDPCYNNSINLSPDRRRCHPCLIVKNKGCRVIYTDTQNADRKVCYSLHNYSCMSCFLVANLSFTVKANRFSVLSKAQFSLGSDSWGGFSNLVQTHRSHYCGS